MDASFNLRAAENHPVVKEDNFISVANKADHSEESIVFCSSSPRQSDSDGNHSTVNVQQCSRLEKENKQENVRDLIARIKYIKSRLDRAESDYRKKRMLKAIIGLQKRVKALVKGMNREKMDPVKGEQETSSYNEGLPGQELADNTVLGSQGTNTTDRELPNNHVITDQGQEKEKSKYTLRFWSKIALFNNRPSTFGTFSFTFCNSPSLYMAYQARGKGRGGEMGEFSPPPPFSEPPSFFFFLSLKY